ncbi:Twitching mobility protein [invertebrate metagenome]|uniref:Twitching mobility protein n=1 Tax=invertebrate metagenome TaxID=1711999 RepID=A0A2H9T6K1_9ZZZZ
MGTGKQANVNTQVLDMDKALQVLNQQEGSELFVTVGYPVSIRVNGRIVRLNKSVLTKKQVEQAILSVMDEPEFHRFCEQMESNFALDKTEIGRFRVSALYQKGMPAMVIRRIHMGVPSMEKLGLPVSLGNVIMKPRGLILVVGPAGSGKTTSMAALLDHRNRQGNGHIITIEDPVEYVHEHKQCIITQRDVGLDTQNFEVALSNTLRQSPDIIAVGEIRNPQIMKYALQYVETGHLCIATLHANNSYQALERIVHFYPVEQRPQLLMDLSLNMQAIVGQQLIPSKNQDKPSLATEILLNTPRIADLMQQGKIDEISSVMKKSQDQGMQTFDQSIYKLYETGIISYEKALLHATSANDLRLMIKLKGKNTINTDNDLGLSTEDESVECFNRSSVKASKKPKK